ncbi:hypothetical protein AB4084_39720, partial [Lysobacter sp. 2RAB21]
KGLLDVIKNNGVKADPDVLKSANELAARHPGKVLAVEPHIDALPEKLKSPNLILVDFPTASAQADIGLLLVDHKPFREQAAPTH